MAGSTQDACTALKSDGGGRAWRLAAGAAADRGGCGRGRAPRGPRAMSATRHLVCSREVMHIGNGWNAASSWATAFSCCLCGKHRSTLPELPELPLPRKVHHIFSGAPIVTGARLCCLIAPTGLLIERAPKAGPPFNKAPAELARGPAPIDRRRSSIITQYKRSCASCESALVRFNARQELMCRILAIVRCTDAGAARSSLKQTIAAVCADREERCARVATRGGGDLAVQRLR